jgi:hypothetical protein
MEDQFIYILSWFYGISGFITLLAFVPTMIDLWNKKPSANISTYIIWSSTTSVVSLYGFFVLQDLLFNIVINLQFLACIIVLILRLRLKYIK